MADNSKRLRIADFRDAVDTLNWNRSDLAGATRDEFLAMDVETRLQRHIDIVQALMPQVPPRFADDLQMAVNAVERASSSITRWKEARVAAAGDARTMIVVARNQPNPLDA